MQDFTAGDVLAFEIPQGVPGVMETLKIMRRVVKDYRMNPVVVQTARRLIANIPDKDFATEAAALFFFVRDEIRYTLDSNGGEMLQTPERLLTSRQGDCDDKATLLAAMLESIGHPARFRAVGFQPGELSHVLVETKIGEIWYPLETTEPVEPGWSPPGVVFSRVVHI